MKIRSITTKFILIISILMAFIMAIQLYYNNKAQEDILSELNRLKQSINTTTDRILVERFEPEGISLFSDSLIWANEPFVHEHQVENDELIVNGNTKIWSYKTPAAKLDGIERLNSVAIIDSFRKHTIIDLKSKLDVIVADGPHFTFNKIIKDSSDHGFEIVEYDLNPPKAEKRVNSFFKSREEIKEEDVISFEFPNLMFTDEPKKLRYNYRTAEFYNTLDGVQDRNILLTLGLFALSIVMITIVTGKFLKPIKSLNQSFDKVAQGDLDVIVEPKSKDEIGELSASFNHMVNELRKNKDREELTHRQERLASLGQLAAGVAHEIKNPLNAINLTIEHLNDKFINAKEQQAVGYVNTIQKEIRRLDKTVNNLLSYLRSENLVKKNTDVNILLDEIFHLYEREITANKISLQKNYADKCILKLDAERFKTVLMNIVSNSIQAMDQGGEIKISTSQKDQSIYIEDSGPGIPQKNLENIFDLFYTTKSAGTGLGLPTAYKIMQEHGGSISIQSKEQQGTKVIIKFNE